MTKIFDIFDVDFIYEIFDRRQVGQSFLRLSVSYIRRRQIRRRRWQGPRARARQDPHGVSGPEFAQSQPWYSLLQTVLNVVNYASRFSYYNFPPLKPSRWLSPATITSFANALRRTLGSNPYLASISTMKPSGNSRRPAIKSPAISVIQSLLPINLTPAGLRKPLATSCNCPSGVTR
jgi:hypothetical protein